MKDNSKYERLIFKFLSHEISDEELIELETWARKEKNLGVVEEYLKLNYFINLGIHDFDALKSYQKALIQKAKPTIFKGRIRKLSRYAAAAVLCGVLATSYFLIDNLFENKKDNTPIIVNNNTKVGTDKATLTLENGEEVALIKGASFQTPNANSNGQVIVYNRAVSKDIVYNTLTIPRGGQYQVILSDGTQVWLNSDSQIKYPVSFVEGKTRSIEIIYGEAYFDVSSSSFNKGADFKVFNSNQEVRVLGTEFNIKAYKDENTIKTTLVEGRVEINCKGINQILNPNQQSNLNLDDNTITVSSIDVYKEISWKDGVFSFENMALKDIMKVLSRWYDIEVVFKNKNLENLTFNGGLKKNQSLVDILSIIKNMNNIDYEINNKTVVFM